MRLPWRRLEGARCSGIALITVEEGLSKPGCPVCRLVREAEERVILDVLREGLNDPGVREEVGESLGFCPYHAWMLVRVVEKHGMIDALGASILYEDMLSRLLDTLRKKRLAGIEGECLLCRFAREFEKTYVSFFAETVTSKKMSLARTYEESKSILCVKHYKEVLNRIKDPQAKKMLEETHLRKLEKLLSNLREYIRKNDYTSREEKITSEEATAWIRAIEALKGYDTSTTILEPLHNKAKQGERMINKILANLLGKTQNNQKTS